MVKLQEFAGQFSVTIPQAYVEQAKWEKGENLTVSFNERGNIELAKVKK